MIYIIVYYIFIVNGFNILDLNVCTNKGLNFKHYNEYVNASYFSEM